MPQTSSRSLSSLSLSLLQKLAAALFAFALTSVFAAAASAQIRMTQLDEISQEVTVQNFGGSAADVSSYQMCREPGTYQALSTLTIVSGDLNLDPGEEVTFVYTFVLSAGTGIGLYISGPFGTPANMADYMQYKGVAGFRENIAVQAGLWTAGEFATGPSGPYFYTGDGSTENGAAFWTNDPPTPPSQTPALSGWGTFALAGALGVAWLAVRGRMRRTATS